MRGSCRAYVTCFEAPKTALMRSAGLTCLGAR